MGLTRQAFHFKLCNIERLASDVPCLYRGFMASNEKQRPLAEIVGERLKGFREERGLRQADVAAAAAKWGLAWARSSIAALEAGSRNLSLEEVLLLPVIIDDLGGWDQPLIHPDTWISLTPTWGVEAKHLGDLARNLAIPNLIQVRDTPLSDTAFGVRKTEQRESSSSDSLYGYQMEAENQAWRLFCARYYPEAPYREISHGANLGSDLELVAKLAKRIENPNGGPASWGLINVLSWALWKAPFEEERDRRAGERGDRTERAFQSAKGHVTRELIKELEGEAHKIWPEVNALFGELAAIWEDADRLDAWTTEARRQAGRLYGAHHRANDLRSFEAKRPAESAALEEIANLLGCGRKSAGLSVEEVADAMMISSTTVEQIESGEYLKARTEGRLQKYVKAFAHAVGTDADSLLQRIAEARKADRGEC